MAASPTDSDPNRQKDSAQDEMAIRMSKAVAALRAKIGSDLNASIPQLEYDPATKKRFYDTAPVPLKRLFSSPLVQSGPNATGPGKERQIASGWGDPRSTAYDKHVNAAARHMGLDFIAPIGEQIMACASGYVSFVGFQARDPSHQAVNVVGVHADLASETILNAKNEIVASKAADNIGFGGICVFVRHDDDFAGYQTEYYHLSNTHVALNQRVNEGDLLGNVGTTGGYYGFFPGGKGSHLHWQVVLAAGGLRVIVRPTAMVPNYWPGHLDSTNSNAATNIILPFVETVAGQVASSRMANAITALNRATTLQNKSTADVKQDMSQGADRMARTLDVQTSALYAAKTGFQGQAPVVQTPMTFDFTAGTWLPDGKVT